MDALREQGRNATAGRRHGTLQNTLVVVQTTLGVALLVAAGYLIRGFVNVREVDTGFRPQHLLEFMLPLTQVRYPDAKKAAFYEALLPKLAALPGVSMASGGYPLPLFGHFASATVEVDGRPNPPGHELSTLVGNAEPGFFETLGVPLVRGRLFTRGDDDPRAPLVAVVNQAFARRYFAGLDPIGRHIRPDLRELRNQAKDVDPTGDAEREIVGVIADVREDSLLDPPESFAVFPYAQASAMMRPTVLLRVTGDPMRYEKAVAAVVAGMDPTLFLLAPRSVETIMGNRTATQRFETWLIAGFSGIALFLTGLGFYSMLATMVVSRTREIGVRMAIGADRRDIAGLVLTRASMLLVAGATVGGIAAAVALRVVKSSDWSQELLFGVSGSDPRILTLTAAVLAAVAVCGCLLPTLRATRIDPARALRDE
jgi:putative ABC transport system permease protein